MYNFVNEIKTIKNKHLKCFVGNDYFHDGFINTIHFTNDGHDIELDIACEREWAVDDVRSGTWFENRKNEKYLYKLMFHKCVYFRSELNEVFPLEYINGRFKKSSILQEIELKTNQRYYHLRIQIASGRYIDIIFRGFSISRVIGEITIFDDSISLIDSIYESSKRVKLTDNEKIRELALNGDWLERYYAIQLLSINNDAQSVEISINALTHDDDEVKLAAIYAIGEHGSESLINSLLENWFSIDYPIHKRHVLDAIEKIKLRSYL